MNFLSSPQPVNTPDGWSVVAICGYCIQQGGQNMYDHVAFAVFFLQFLYSVAHKIQTPHCTRESL